MTITVKQPSKELMEMISAAASSLMSFGELWGTIKHKGEDEGFQETDLQDMLRPLLKDRLGMNKDRIYYLFHQDKKKEQSKQTYHRNITKISPKKEPEQFDSTEDIFDKKPMVPVKNYTQFYKEQDDYVSGLIPTVYKKQSNITKELNEVKDSAPDLFQALAKEDPSLIKQEDNEEPTELELKDIRIAQLEDALKKTEQFKPASWVTNENKATFAEEEVFEWLAKRENRTTIFFFPNYGRELFKTRILTQLESSGVKSFKRLYFEI